MGHYVSKFFQSDVNNEIKVFSELLSPQNLDDNFFSSEEKGETSQSSLLSETLSYSFEDASSKLQKNGDGNSYDNNVTSTVDAGLDPRSPNIACPRTPIMIQSKSATNSATSEINLWNKSLVNFTGYQQSINYSDPRSPANDFERTPIFKTKSNIYSNTLTKEKISKYKVTNSNLDFCIKLAYCETTSLFGNIPEIQVLPDIVCNFKKAYNKKKKSNAFNLSFVAEDNNIGYNSSSDNSVFLTPKTFSCTSVEKKNAWENENLMKIEDNTDVNSQNNLCEIPINTLKIKEQKKKIVSLKKNFAVWDDSTSFKISPRTPRSQLNYLQKHTLIASKTKENERKRSKYILKKNVKNNWNEEISRTKKHTRKIENRNLDNKKNKSMENTKFNLEHESEIKIPKNRTPLGKKVVYNNTEVLKDKAQIIR